MPDPKQKAKASELPPIDLNPRQDAPLDFPDREFGALTPQDCAELGFLCGLEVHQQLLTKSKLFCRCPAGLRVDRTDAGVLRHMRPTLSEMGEYDGCALMEFKTRKEIIYLLEHSTVCTYEMDDTPPFEIDEKAVRIALSISRLFDLRLVSELQVMRKQYLDGSIPTGFQRTAMVGIGGVIPFRESELGCDRELRIRQLTLEEDSCREVTDIGHRITFRTDRLGMPLIETVTEPDLLTPNDVAAGGRLLARVAQVSRKVRRGAGAGRQDVNVSIAGSRRVEIKGVCRHSVLPLLVHNEAYRHLNLLRIRHALHERGIEAALLQKDGLHFDAGELLAKCGYAPIANCLRAGQAVRAVRLPGFAGLLSHRTQPGLCFDQEFSERVRVIACLMGQPFMIHDDMHEDRLPGSTWREIRRELAADADDAVVLVWGEPTDMDTAANEVLRRGEDALRGVPSETRQAHADGTTGFERILPGPERMYPDTDTRPLPIPDEWVAEIDNRTCELPWQRADRYAGMGLDESVAERLARAPWADLFDELAPREHVTTRRLAAALEKRIPHFWRAHAAGAERVVPNADRLRPLVEAIDAGTLHVSGIEFVLDRLLREDGTPARDIIREHEMSEDDRVSQRIVRFVGDPFGGDPRGRPWPSTEARLRGAMGIVLATKPRGSVDPRSVRQKLEQVFEAART